MAAGDIIGVEILAEGWMADVTAQVAAGGTFASGLGTNGDPDTGSPNLTFTATSLGYDTSGVATTCETVIHATKIIRKPSPNEAQAQETDNGNGTVTFRVALSDYVYAKDKAGGGNSGVDVTWVAEAGLYTGTNAGSGTATNSSTAAYPKVIGNWTWPGYNKIGSTYKLRFMAGHLSVADGKPVQCVKFTSVEGINTSTQTVSAITVDETMGDANPIPEYVATMDGSGFTQGNQVTHRAQAYPRRGDSDSVLDTFAGTAQPTPLYGPIVDICDKAGTYANSVAVVDPTGGNDGTGTVTTDYLTALPFATIDGAADALRTYNSTNLSRANKAGSIIYLKTGNHAWIGGTTTADGVSPDAWVTVTRYPGLAVGDAVINSQSGSKTIGARTKIVGVTITGQSATGTISHGSGVDAHLWVDGCVINCPTASQPPFYQNKVWYLTRNTITSLNMGIRPFSTTNNAPAIVRGNTIVDLGTSAITCYTVIGNRRTSNTGLCQLIDFYTGQTIPAMDNIIVMANHLTTASTSVEGLKFGSTTKTITHGALIAQNVFEQVSGSVSSALVSIGADGTTGDPVNNVQLWHNVIVGQRLNMAYNDNGANAPVRRFWGVFNNLVEDNNIKTDTFATANGARVANWAEVWGVRHSGNLFAQITGIGVPNTFDHEFPGLRSIQPATAQALSYTGFVDRKASNGTLAGAGNGDYHLLDTSPAYELQLDYVLPFDLSGDARYEIDAAGAYASGVVPAVDGTDQGGFLRSIVGVLVTTTSTTGAVWEGGFLRSPDGELVVTTSTSGATWQGGFLRSAGGALVIENAEGTYQSGFARTSSGALAVTQSTGSYSGGYVRTSTGRLSVSSLT